jgi:hypothetical protein
MTQAFRQDLLATGHFAVRAMSVALTGTAIALALVPRHAVDVTPPIADVSATPVTVRVPEQIVEHEAAPPLPPLPGGHFAFVVRAGAKHYVELASLDVDIDQGKLVLEHDDDGVYTAVAPVRVEDVPAAYRPWLGRHVVVDGKCTARVTGFAMLARLTGDPGYAGIDSDHWTKQTIRDKGTQLLVAAIDGCSGTYARDAALPAMPALVPVSEPDLEAKARATLIASEVAADAQRAWHDDWEMKGNWWDASDVTITTRAMRHARTGVVWISVIAHRDHGCGDAEVDVWGLFRVARDGSLKTVSLRHSEELDTLDELLDVDGDGVPELLGKPWLGLDHVLERPDGTELSRLPLQFYGCPC